MKENPETTRPRDERTHQSDGGPPPDNSDPVEAELPRDELDAMLRQWHTVNAAKAAAGRDRLTASLRQLEQAGTGAGAPAASAEPKYIAPALPSLLSLEPEADPDVREERARRHKANNRSTASLVVLRRIVMNRYSPGVAALIVLAVLLPFFLPSNQPGRPGGIAFGPAAAAASDGNIVMCPEGGRLDARDDEGNVLGPFVLKHTDVTADVSGFLNRVTVRQQYHNPHPDKIEAVYTFPLSHRGAVDRMTMTIGNRVIIGQVKERAEARHIYEQAKAQGRVASLLEQERPNIFTQSIANIEPGADITIEISYVEFMEATEGAYSFIFPTVVGPRYIPGYPTGTIADKQIPPPPQMPPHLQPRRGLVLLAPATVSNMQAGDLSVRPALTPGYLSSLLHHKARPIRPVATAASVWYNFQAAYADGSAELGTLYTDGTGVVGGRWFWAPVEQPGPVDRGAPAGDGGGFSPPTNQVPDADRITPMPVHPSTRAGHDISITVNIDTGGPGIVGPETPLHTVITNRLAPDRGEEGGLPSRVSVSLVNSSDIPNRDFVLNWRQTADRVEPAVFAHTGDTGNFFQVTLMPPARVDDTMAVPRELIFVLDTSGSMNGFPIEKAKEVMLKAIGSMRGLDTFNVITFSGHTQILWPTPRPATPDNIAEAQRLVASRQGGGGTEMMQAINAALMQAPHRPMGHARESLTPQELANLPADGREVDVLVPWDGHSFDEDGGTHWIKVRDGLNIRTTPYTVSAPPGFCRVGESLRFIGRWKTVQGERVLEIASATYGGAGHVQPLRIVMFMTDGYVGNDMAIIDAIQKNRGTTRVFSFGVGNSVNRYLLDNMARAGGGEAEYVLLADGANDAVERFTRRVRTPVLTNISVEFSPGLQPLDTLTALGTGGGGGVADLSNIPDLFDQKSLTIMGRYNTPGSGTVTISGMTATGPWRRTINLDMPAREPRNDTVPTLWARSKVESIMNANLQAAQQATIGAEARQQIVGLGETFGIVTQYTSFVAVDRLRVTIGGRPRLVHIPIELPQGTRWEGFFGGEGIRAWEDADADRPLKLGYTYDEVPGIDLQSLLQQSQSGGGAGGRLNANTASSEMLRSITAVSGGQLVQDGKEVGELRVLGTEGGRAVRLSSDGREATTQPAIVDLAGGVVPVVPGKDEAQAGQAERAPAGEALEVRGTDLDRQRKVERYMKRVRGAEETKTAPSDTPAPARSAAPAGGAGAGPSPVNTPTAPVAPPPSPPPAPEPAAQPAGDKLREDAARPPSPLLDVIDDRYMRADLEARREPIAPRFDENGNQIVEVLTVGGNAKEQAYRYYQEQERDSAEEKQDAARFKASEGAPRVVPARQVFAVAIGEFIKEGKVDDARALARYLVSLYPDYETGSMLAALVAAEPVDAGAVEKIAAAARTEFDGLIRDAHLQMRLHESLMPYTTAQGLAMTLPALHDGYTPDGATMIEGGILLTILVKEIDDGTEERFTKAGLRVEMVDKPTRLVIGVAPLGWIAEIALLDGVRRVEPTREDEVGASGSSPATIPGVDAQP